MTELEALGKLRWADPHTQQIQEYVLTEGATVTIGRSSNNDIQIAEQHVSRQHCVINYRDGMFMISDLGSSNGTFVNDEQIAKPFPLFAGDKVRLYVPMLDFLMPDDDDMRIAEESGHLITAAIDGQASLIVTNGPQEGQTIPLLLDEVKIGRATSNAQWEIVLQDPSVSRPHAVLKRTEAGWTITDLGSSNGTMLNSQSLDGTPRNLTDGDMLTLGGSILLFRSHWHARESGMLDADKVE
jgi:pSer/pThr/pTyr-binding forkhead associated (FHA) protein